MLSGKIVSFDTETTGLDVYQGARLFAYTAANDSGETLYAEDDCFPRHLAGTAEWPGNYGPEADHKEGPVRKGIRQWMADPSIVKVFHNAKFDLKMLDAFGIEVAGEIHDTMIMAHLLGAQGAAGPKFNENVLKRLSLATLSHKYLNVEKDDGPKAWLKRYARLASTVGRPLNYSDVPLDIMEPYARRDAECTLKLYHVFMPHLQDEPRLMKVYRMEMELLRHIKGMEDRGVRLDIPFMDQRVKELTDLEQKSRKYLVAHSPTLKLSYNKTYTRNKVKLKKRMIEVIKPNDINFSSDEQMIQVLYNPAHFGFPILGWTQVDPSQDAEKVPMAERGQPSVDERCLSRIDHPYTKELVRYRQYLKTRDTYFIGYRKHMVKDVLHPNYNQAATQTGRFSSTAPNLQNITMEKQVRERAGADVVYKGVKRAFIPRPGYVNMHFDYSSIELRMFAHLVNDPQIIDAVVNYDLHDWTTELLFGAKSTMTAQEFEYKRVLAKIVNFGILYGMGVKTFMWKMKKTKEEVDDLLGKYFGRLPAVRTFQQDVIGRVHQDGYLTNVFGRRYVIEPNYAYKGVNYLCQGSAADTIKRAMVRVGRYLSDKKSSMLMTIHDEIVCEVHLSELEYVPKTIVGLMAHNPEFRLPIKVSAEVAVGNWENLCKLEDITKLSAKYLAGLKEAA